MITVIKDHIPLKASAVFLVAVLCCYTTACQIAPATAPADELAPTLVSTPAVTPASGVFATPEPVAAQARLNPVTFLAALIGQYEEGGRFARMRDIVPVFERFGLDTSIINYYNDTLGLDGNAGVFFSEQDLFVQALPTPDDNNVVAYAALRLSVEGEGLALIFERAGSSAEWAFTGWFPCAEAGFTNDLSPEVTFEQVQTGPEQYNWYLRVRGRRDHGTARQSIQTDWYDLTSRTHALGYMSDMVAMRGDKEYWLGHIISSTDSLAYKSGNVTLAVSYSGALVNTDALGDWDDLESSAFYSQDWQVDYVRGANGSFVIEDEQARQRMRPISLDNPEFHIEASICAKDLMTMFPDMRKTIEGGGTSAQKAAFNKLSAAAKDE